MPNNEAGKVDYYQLALKLKRRGIPFEQAYEMIFGRPPRKIEPATKSA